LKDETERSSKECHQLHENLRALIQEKRNVATELRAMTEIHEKYVDNSKDMERKQEKMAKDLENHRNLC
tara:strand:- start:1035 stop:1241 length:207 start_codon:yes stop_codon:yes gene_type:complete